MSSRDAIMQIRTQLDTATRYAAIFGHLTGADVEGKRAAIRKQFAYLAGLVHPDHVPKELGAEAAETFRMLTKLRRDAEEALKAGTYDAPLTAAKNTAAIDEHFELRSTAGVYTLNKKVFRSGDFSALYRGTNANGVQVLVKIALEPTLNGWLEREAALLAKFRDAHPKDPIAGIKRFVPELLDTFFVGGERGTRYHAEVMRFASGFVSVADIITAYPSGLDAPQAAWVCRRMLAQTIASAMAGVVHGAILPEHVLVEPVKHEPLHLGWAHAVPTGGRITHVLDRNREFYPPEVFDKEACDHRTDLYMAGKTMIKLLGGDLKRNTLPAAVPHEVARLILRSVEKSPDRRPQDGKAYLDDFTRVVRNVWGRVYRPLTMPAGY